MTIRITQPWNGYMPDQVMSLSAPEEARLISLGLATADLDGEPDPEGELVRSKRDPVTGGIEFLTAANQAVLRSQRGKKNRIVSYGSELIDVVKTTGWTRSGAGVVFSASSEWCRRSSTSLKVDMLSATAAATIEWSNATGVLVDPDDQIIAFDIYIPELVSSAIGSPSINIFISNTTSYSAPGTTWVINSNYLRQGVNEIRLCGKDADGALGSYRGTGTLPHGMSKTGATGGTNPLVWTNAIKFISISINYSATNKRVFYIDNIRIPEKIKPFVCLGFDASGSNMTDDIFLDRTAPFLQAKGITPYFTATWEYDAAYIGSQDDERKDTLYTNYGWDAINHSWSHGAGSVGANYTSGNTLVVSGTGTLATLTFSGAHSIAIGKTFPVSVTGATGASATNANGVFMATATTSTQATYAITGGTDGTATGTVVIGTRFADIFNSVAQTNQPIILSATQLAALLKHEVRGIQSYPSSRGWQRGQDFMAYPNNSPPDMRLMETEAAAAGIRLARGQAGTTCRVSMFGVDNPLNLPSTDLSSGTNGSTVDDINNAVQGAINRGEGLFIFGHYLRDESLDAVVDINSPPGKNGNPAAPGTSNLDLWWYAGQLENLVNNVLIPLQESGSIDFLSASECVAELTQEYYAK